MMLGILLPYISDDVFKNNLVRIYNSKKTSAKVVFFMLRRMLLQIFPLVVNALIRDIAV